MAARPCDTSLPNFSARKFPPTKTKAVRLVGRPCEWHADAASANLAKGDHRHRASEDAGRLAAQRLELDNLMRRKNVFAPYREAPRFPPRIIHCLRKPL